MNNKYDWIPFQEEMADKLLSYKNNRSELFEIIKEIAAENDMLNYLHLENNEWWDIRNSEIDPFSIFATFNRQIKPINKINIIKSLAEKLKITTPAPNDFTGIPVMNNQRAFFGGNDEIWELLEIAIVCSANKTFNKDFEIAFEKAVAAKGNGLATITMGLFWIRPYMYLNLDSQNKEFLQDPQNGMKSVVDIIPSSIKHYIPNGNEYTLMCKQALKLVDSGSFRFKNFPEMSHFSWETNPKEDSSKEFVSNLQEEFVNWIKLLIKNDGNRFSSNTINTYCNALKSTVNKLQLDSPVMSSNVFDYTDIYSFNEAYRIILSARNLEQVIAKSGNGAFKSALSKYSEFLTNRNRKGLISKQQLKATIKTKENIESMSQTDIEKNIILYGPPGTGKTYSTVIYAVAIIEDKPLESVKQEDYFAVVERYNKYKADGLIEFTTFHQSYAYEEFIEGIKPVLQGDKDSETDIQYDIISGVFKAFCDKSEAPLSGIDSMTFEIGKNPTVWKVSLEGTGDNPTRTECLENEHIRIGWDDYGEVISDTTDYSKMGGKGVLNAFYNKMQIGDIVMSCYTNKIVDAIGIVTGEPEWHEQYAKYKRVRKVNWLVKQIATDIVDLNGGKTMTLPAVHSLSVSVNDALAIVKQQKPELFSKYAKISNKVFIIDEINRGNISKIFGELITLIEHTKRKGQDEALEVKLPYSLKYFGVPNNVYLVGTMNTADRSISTIDTALRRRFSFKEMQPELNVLSDIVVDGVSIREMLESMNRKISVLYDREHTIGHSYFIPLKKSPDTTTLAKIFENNIIPLLQEYFYEDYEKIQLVLGDNKKHNKMEQFIIAKDNDYGELFGDFDISFDETKSYEINPIAFGNIEAYRSI